VYQSQLLYLQHHHHLTPQKNHQLSYCRQIRRQMQLLIQTLLRFHCFLGRRPLLKFLLNQL
jgi:hypothetical protein